MRCRQSITSAGTNPSSTRAPCEMQLVIPHSMRNPPRPSTWVPARVQPPTRPERWRCTHSIMSALRGTSEPVPRGARYDPNAVDARSAVQPHSHLCASRATQQTRVWVVTRRDEGRATACRCGVPPGQRTPRSASAACVGAFRCRNLLQYCDIAASLLLELHPTAPPSRPRGTGSEVP